MLGRLSRGPGWLSGGMCWRGSFGSTRSIRVPVTALLKHLGSGTSSCPAHNVIFIGSAASRPAALRAGKVQLGSNAVQQEHVNLSAGQPRDVQGKEPSGFFIFCNEALKRIFFPPSLHTLERGREGPPAQYEKVTFKKSNSLEAKANGTRLFAFV